MKHLITSALPYINGVKHLGNLIGSMLPADVYARYLRQTGHEVLYICATDEHGTPAELAAAASQESVQTYCTRMHKTQAAIYKQFSLSFDHFGRTSNASNHELTARIYQQLKSHGFIEQHATRQLYCHADGRFLPDRYVIGTCPRCGYEAARGDQCENCASVLEPTDLIRARSAISGSDDLEIRDSAHLFLKLSSLQSEVAAWVEAHCTNWTDLTTSIARKWLTEGLHDRCITRDLRWGIPVPENDPELAGKVFYVWFDAPIGYIAATRDWAVQRGEPQAWESWWCNNREDVEYTQFMAKDNVPFHAIMFPAMLLGTREDWRQPKRIKGFNWLNYYGGKFSTSSNRGVFLDTALELFSADYWRYGLLSIAPESKDGVFTWEEYQQKVNKDLNDNLGNFVNRVLRFAAARFGDTIPDGGTPGPEEEALTAQCNQQAQLVGAHVAALEFRKASEALRDFWSLGNLYIDRAAPWKTIETDRDKAALAIRTCINIIRLHGTISEPFIPDAAKAMREALDVTLDPALWRGEVSLLALKPGTTFKVPVPLFAKIDAKMLAELKNRFAGEEVSAPTKPVGKAAKAAARKPKE